MRVVKEPKFYLRTWRESGQLTPSKFLERLDKRVEELTLHDKKAQLDTLRQIYSHPTLELYLQTAAFSSQVGISTLEKAGPVLYRMLNYLSRYPFLPPPAYDETSDLTPNGLLRALVLTSSEHSGQLFNGGSHTRAHTPADHCRMLFQALATPQKTTSHPLSSQEEQDWRAKASKRAHELGSVERQELLGENASTNRTEDGDEIFHDLVDIMFLTQPDGPDMPPHVHRNDLVQLAKELVAENGLCPDALHSFTLARPDFTALVHLLLVLHLELEDNESVPDNFEHLRDHIVRSFFEQDDEINFNKFYDAFSSDRTNFVGYNLPLLGLISILTDLVARASQEAGRACQLVSID